MTTDCPWCDGSATIDPTLSAIHCDDCQVVVEIAAEAAPALRLDAAA